MLISERLFDELSTAIAKALEEPKQYQAEEWISLFRTLRDDPDFEPLLRDFTEDAIIRGAKVLNSCDPIADATVTTRVWLLIVDDFLILSEEEDRDLLNRNQRFYDAVYDISAINLYGAFLMSYQL